MSSSTISKTDFIKFNVSPKFKILAEKKAREHGMTLSELGRMLFGSFVSGVAKPSHDISPTFLKLADKAKKEYKAGKVHTFSSTDELMKFLDSTE